jgi:hypothetical protein
MSRELSDRDERVLSTVAALARDASPDALEVTRAEQMIRRAALGAGGTRARRAQVAALVATAALAAAAATLVTLSTSDEPEAPASPSARTASEAPGDAPILADPMEIELPSGDRITAVEGSRFELLSVTEEDRRVSLTRGAMLFDVARLGESARFEVVTRDLRARVLAAGAPPEDPRLSSRGRRAAEARVAEATSAQGDAETDTATTEAARPPSTESDLPSIDEARALIASGDAEGALLAARRVLAEDPNDAGSRLVEADALRALRRFAEAVAAYDRVAASPSPARARAGFRAASIRPRRNHPLRHAPDYGPRQSARSAVKFRKNQKPSTAGPPELGVYITESSLLEQLDPDAPPSARCS